MVWQRGLGSFASWRERSRGRLLRCCDGATLTNEGSSFSAPRRVNSTTLSVASTPSTTSSAALRSFSASSQASAGTFSATEKGFSLFRIFSLSSSRASSGSPVDSTSAAYAPETVVKAAASAARLSEKAQCPPASDASAARYCATSGAASSRVAMRDRHGRGGGGIDTSKRTPFASDVSVGLGQSGINA